MDAISDEYFTFLFRWILTRHQRLLSNESGYSGYNESGESGYSGYNESGESGYSGYNESGSSGKSSPL